MNIRDVCGNIYGVNQQTPELKTLTFTVWDDGNQDDVMPDDVAALAGWLLKKLELIPAEHRGTATFNDECRSDYDGGCDHERSITYTRLETPDEARSRVEEAVRQNAAERARSEAHERHVLAQLQAKYGTK